jgi:flagellar biosynthesis/type III secretory pathway chaperone
MKVRNAGDLPALVARKNGAIGELMQNENFMIHLFSDHADESSVADLRQQLEACRELNRLNQSIAAIELNATRRSLELLRSLQRMDDLPLYGSAGKINVVREKRNLGEA